VAQLHDEALMNELKLLDAGPAGTTLYELVIDDKYSNLNGSSAYIEMFFR